MNDRHQSSALTCHHCGALGTITWEQTGAKSHKISVDVSGDFHFETGRTTPDGNVTVCNQCDEIHDAFPAGNYAP